MTGKITQSMAACVGRLGQESDHAIDRRWRRAFPRRAVQRRTPDNTELHPDGRSNPRVAPRLPHHRALPAPGALHGAALPRVERRGPPAPRCPARAPPASPPPPPPTRPPPPPPPSSPPPSPRRT